MATNGAEQDGRTRPFLPAQPQESDNVVADPLVKEASNGRVNPSDAPAAATTPEQDAICRRNIRMMLVFQTVSAIAWGTAMGPVFDKYLYYLGGGAAIGPTLAPKAGRNSLVGMTESISGLASLVLAIPVGVVVDWCPTKRARLLKLSSLFGVAATLVGIVAVLSDVILALYASLVLLGVFSELSNSCSEAIFADSIPQGQRTGIFTTKAILSTVGSACGPGLSAICLFLLGDEWEPYQMKAVYVFGSILMPISCVALFFFDDPPSRQPAPQPETDGAGQAQEEGASAQTPPSPTGRLVRRFGPLKPRHVPFILALSDFTTCVGAGMTVKFFSLFFIQDQHFSPISICALSTAYPLVIALFMKFTERLSKPLGRPQASLLFFGSNVLCLALLSRVRSLPFLLAVYLVRGGFANSTYPIDRSILMDYTPSSQRGCWNAVESFTSITWSGSAFVGGLLSDQHDYRYTFLVTAFVYFVGCLIYAPLLRLVPRREGEAALASRDLAFEEGEMRQMPLVQAGPSPAAQADGER